MAQTEAFFLFCLLESLDIAAITDGKVELFRSQLDTWPLSGCNAVDMLQIENGFFVAEITGRLDLFDRICELHEAPGSFKKKGFEIRTQPIANDGNFHF